MQHEQSDLFTHFLDVWCPQTQHLHQEFRSAHPFPNIMLDNFLPTGIAEYILEHFPAPDFPGFQQPDNEFQVGKLGKVQDRYFRGVQQGLRHLLQDLNSMAALEFLEQLSGIEGLIPDPHFRGGAFHQVLPGGRLGIHADFNVDQRRKLMRRLNVLIYFNKKWNSECGGELELWDTSAQRCERRIQPIFNRCVIFETSSNSYHGHPNPVSRMAPEYRKSLAFYYYTAHPDAFNSDRAHSTIWKEQPGPSRKIPHER